MLYLKQILGGTEDAPFPSSALSTLRKTCIVIIQGDGKGIHYRRFHCWTSV